MINDVAKALCNTAGKTGLPDGQIRDTCVMCEKGVCQFWEKFIPEAKVAIKVAYLWNKKERRWPSFVHDRDHS